MLRRLAPVRREFALHVRDGRVVDVHVVPVRHDVVHHPGHHDLAGTVEQVVGVPVLVLGGLVVIEAALGVRVHAVGGDDDVEVESSHGWMVGPPAEPSQCGAMTFDEALELAVQGFEMLGVGILVAGSVVAIVDVRPEPRPR